MKKLLIATAALAMVTGTVQAQSTVTAYGRLDSGYRDSSTTTAAGVKTQTENITFNSFTTSRLGFMGTEDLGGGTQARFMIEGALQVSVPTVSSNETLPFQFGRQQWLSLSNAKTGTLLVGKTDSLVKGITDTFDAGYANNLTGTYDGMGTSLTDITGSNVMGNARDLVIRYTTPKFSGFDVSLGLLKQSSNTVTAAAVQETGSGYEAGASYSSGALAAAFGLRKADTKTNATTGVAGACIDATVSIGVVAANAACATGYTRLSGTKAIAAADVTVNSANLGASYNFGPAIVYGAYFEQDNKDNVAGSKTTEEAYQVGVRVPMGKSTLFATYTAGEFASATSVKTDIEGVQMGIKYDLSKRTYGYVAYGQTELQQDGQGKAKSSQVAAGVAHSF